MSCEVFPYFVTIDKGVIFIVSGGIKVKRWLGLLAVFLLSVFATLFIGQQTSYAPTSTEIIRKQQAENQEGIVLDQVVQNFYIGEQDKSGSRTIAQFDKTHFPAKRMQYALHHQDAYVLLTVRTNDTLEQVEELFSQMKIEGNVRYSTTIQELSKDSFELRINFRSIKNRITINFGNLPPISLRKMLPLQVKVVPDANSPAALLLTGNSDTPAVIFATKQQKWVNLLFSEPMVDRESIGPQMLDGVAGSWLDEQTYRLSLEKVGEKPIDMRSLLARSGNHLPASFDNVYVRKVTEREWIDYASGKSVGSSLYDTFYDQLVYAPNHDKYVGVINVGSGQADRFGNTFGLILEQPGKAPTIIEGMFYSNVLQHDSPIQWIDSDRFLFASRDTMYVYDCRTDSKKELFHNQFDKTKGSIHAVQYDPFKKQLYLLVSFHVDDRDKDFYYVDKWVVDGVDGDGVEKSYFSNVFLAYKYQLQPLPINVSNDAIFWTKTSAEQKQVYTVRQDRNGKEETVPGRIVMQDANGNAILVQDRDSSGNSIDERYYWWENGKKPRFIPPKAGVIQSFHSTLLATDKGKYYQYDAEMRDWVETHFDGKEIYVPDQESSGYYRRKKLSEDFFH